MQPTYLSLSVSLSGELKMSPGLPAHAAFAPALRYNRMQLLSTYAASNYHIIPRISFRLGSLILDGSKSGWARRPATRRGLVDGSCASSSMKSPFTSKRFYRFVINFGKIPLLPFVQPDRSRQRFFENRSFAHHQTAMWATSDIGMI